MITMDAAEPSDRYYIGVDVGTSSARAGLFTASGSLVTVATHPIKIWEPQDEYYEQSSEDIWSACCAVVRSVIQNIDTSLVKGLGFDATCSLVVLDENGHSLPVNESAGDDSCDVIMWMDHRAKDQCDKINATNHEILKYVGGKAFLEMEMPKLLWLKENLPDTWTKAGYFFELPDYLTWRATGSASRSLCSTVCKWNMDGNTGWDSSFLTQIGLHDLCLNNYAKIGSSVLPPGHPCGEGLTSTASSDLGLQPGTVVGTSIIDAHAGALGTLGCTATDNDLSAVPLTSRLALISGTSTCHISVCSESVFVPGIWGPYFSALVPELWMMEAGQSATGKLIDHIVQKHVAYPWIKEEADRRNVHEHSVLNEILEFTAQRQEVACQTELTRHLHVWPDFHGNRSPLADAGLKGMICGLSLSSRAEDLAVQYLATLQALGYGTRHILETQQKHGHHINVLYICGGLSKNKLFVQTHADITGYPVVLPETAESVLLGSAMLGACASGDVGSVQEAMQKMGGKGKVIQSDCRTKIYHDQKYKVFLKMVEHQKVYAGIMNEATI